MRPLTSRETVIIALAIVLAVVIPLYRLVFAPEFDTLAALNGRIAAQTRTLASVGAEADRLPAVRRDFQTVEARVRTTEQGMPTSIHISILMARLSAAIAASGIQLIEVTFPKGTQPSESATEPVEELPITVHFRGTFARTIAFMRLMEARPAAVTEESVSIAAAGAPPGGTANPANLDVTMGIRAFAIR